MSDSPTVQQAADWARRLRRMADDQRVNTVGYFTPEELRGVAGLLADPTPALTPEQQAVIDAASVLVAWHRKAPGGWLPEICLPLVAAVDRLAATTKEPT